MLDVGDERGRVGLGFAEVGAELGDGLLQQIGLADGVFGGADVDGGARVVARGDRLLRRGQLRIGEGQVLRGLRRIVGDRGQSCGSVRPLQNGERGRGGLLPYADLGTQRLHAGEGGGRVLLELTQLVERLRLLVETGVGARAQVEDLRVPGAHVGFGVGGRVVELLLQHERLVEGALRVGEGLGELGGRGVAELGARETELLLARLQGVVGRDERRRGATSQLVGGHLGERVVRGIRAGRAARDRRRLLAARAHHDHNDEGREGDHDDHEQDGREGAARAAPRVA